MGIGPPELIIVMVIALLLFGNRIPSIAKSLGQGVTQFKKGINSDPDEEDEDEDEAPRKKSKKKVKAESDEDEQ